MRISTTKTVIGVATPTGTTVIASPRYNPDHFAEVVMTLHPDTDVDLQQVDYAETPEGGVIWYVPLAAISQPDAEVVDLRDGLEGQVV